MLTLLLFTLALLGCQDVVNSLLDNGAPTGVSASDGDYASEIQVSWGAPSMSGDKWKDDSIQDYLVSWSSANDTRNATTTSTSYSIPITNDADRAQMYTVTVTARFKNYGTGVSASDEGFAIDTEDLIWRDGGSNYTITGNDRWYVTMLQKGFTYSFAFPVGEKGTVSFYPYKTLNEVNKTSDAGNVQSWKCDEDGASHKFYVKVDPDSPSSSFGAAFSF